MTLKVLYVLPPTKTFAGIERVVDEIGDHMSKSMGHRIDVDVLFTWNYETNKVENRSYRKIQRQVKGRWELIRTLREVAGRAEYDLVVVPQVEATVIAWLSCLGRRKNFVLYLHGNPKLEMRSWKAKVLFYLMDKVVLRRLAGVFGVSKTQLEAFRVLYPSNVPHVWVPNPVRRFEQPLERATVPGQPVTYVNVGRFSYQKGHDILVTAFAKAYRTRKNIRLVLVGYGPMDDLVRLIKSLDLESVVRIAYHPDNPQEPLAASDVYVSTSRWEGWSLAICEALRVGLPVIATDCEFGPSDILTDRRLGLLVPLDDDAIAAAMVEFHDNLQREARHRQFRMDYIDTFSVETVVHDHAAALEHVSQTSRKPEALMSHASARAS
ncbi:glycosyltransferase [Methylobacterium sp. 77]|uniref:glycosyltransferase n=1 Tax=Methylobacterium sp. 77 TaxID=1101192 RepID=UPI000372E682|nr:glycosyltransferase [Methylobacterium sp. 77]